MIVRTKRGYKVMSEDGSRALSADDLTMEEAKMRLEQIEFFKNRDRAMQSARKGTKP